MTFNHSQQQAIIELMTGKYAQILPIEQEWGIRLHEGDMRPRIEHFHDAVRALTSGEANIYEKNSRLSAAVSRLPKERRWETEKTLLPWNFDALFL